jgi:hypothetical protein
LNFCVRNGFLTNDARFVIIAVDVENIMKRKKSSAKINKKELAKYLLNLHLREPVKIN